MLTSLRRFDKPFSAQEASVSQTELDALVEQGQLTKSQGRIVYRPLADPLKSLRDRIHVLEKEEHDITAPELDLMVKAHIHSLHLYNDLKDAGQSLLGRIAVYEGKTTRDLYEEFDLNEGD